MTRAARNSGLFCAVGILLASAALAQVPDPAHSSLAGDLLTVEGYTGPPENPPFTPDPCIDGRSGDFLVTVRDFAHNVIAGSVVILDLSFCSDVQVSCDQLNTATGQTGLFGKKVQGTTDSFGQFTFKIQGASNLTTILPGNAILPGTNAGTKCAVIYADGVPIGQVKVAVYDLNGNGTGVTSDDASIVLADVGKVILGGQARQRDDYNGSNTVNGADASVMLAMVSQQLGGTGSRTTPTLYCP